MNETNRNIVCKIMLKLKTHLCMYIQTYICTYSYALYMLTFDTLLTPQRPKTGSKLELKNNHNNKVVINYGSKNTQTMCCTLFHTSKSTQTRKYINGYVCMYICSYIIEKATKQYIKRK